MSSDRSLSRRDLLRRLATRGGALTALGLTAACALRPTTNGPTAVVPTPIPTPPRLARPTTAKTTLQIWTNWLGPPRQAWDSLMAQFNASQSTIAIVSSYFTLGTLDQQVITAVAAGTPPDLWINAALIRPEFIVDGAVTSLNRLGPVPTDFYPAANPASVRDGQRWGVPNNGGVPLIWYNEGLFQLAGLDPNRPPQTWDDLVRFGKALTVSGQDQWGFIVPNRHYPWTTECWYGFLLQAGGDIFSPDGTTITFNDSAGVEALTFWANLFLVYRTAPRQPFDADTLVSTYGGGAIGMFPMYSVDTNYIAGFPFLSRNTPYPIRVRRGTHFAGSYTTISAASKNQAAAFTWCEWWWQPEINATWCASTGGLPSRVSSTNHPIYQTYLKEQPLARASIASLPFAKALPSILGITEIEQRLSEAIYNACFGLKTPKQALDAAVPAVHEVLATNQRTN